MNEPTTRYTFISTGMVPINDGDWVKYADIEAALEQRWLPIDDAPKDGTVFLAYMGPNWFEGMYHAEGELHYASDGDQPPHGRKLPTHFMPMPEPPKE